MRNWHLSYRFYFLISILFLSFSAQAQQQHLPKPHSWKENPFFLTRPTTMPEDYSLDDREIISWERGWDDLEERTLYYAAVDIAPQGNGTTFLRGGGGTKDELDFDETAQSLDVNVRSAVKLGDYAILLTDQHEILFFDLNLFLFNSESDSFIPIFIFPLEEGTKVKEISVTNSLFGFGKSQLSIACDGTPPLGSPKTVTLKQLDLLMEFELDALLEKIDGVQNQTSIDSHLSKVEYETGINGIGARLKRLVEDIAKLSEERNEGFKEYSEKRKEAERFRREAAYRDKIRREAAKMTARERERVAEPSVARAKRKPPVIRMPEVSREHLLVPPATETSTSSPSRMTWTEDPFFLTSQTVTQGRFSLTGELPQGTNIPWGGRIIRIAPLGDGTAIQWGDTSYIQYLDVALRAARLEHYVILLTEKNEILFFDLDLFSANALDNAGNATPIFIFPLEGGAKVKGVSVKDGELSIAYDGTPPLSSPRTVTVEQLDLLGGFELQLAALMEKLGDEKEGVKVQALIDSQVPMVEFELGIKGVGSVLKSLVSDIAKLSREKHAEVEKLVKENDTSILLKRMLASASEKEGPFWYFLLSDKERSEMLRDTSVLPSAGRRLHFVSELIKLRAHLNELERGRLQEFKSSIDPWRLISQTRNIKGRYDPLGFTIKVKIISNKPNETTAEEKKIELAAFNERYYQAGIIPDPSFHISQIEFWSQDTLVHTIFVDCKGIVATGPLVVLLPFTGQTGMEALPRVIDLETFSAAPVIPIFHAPFGGNNFALNGVKYVSGNHEKIDVEFNNGERYLIWQAAIREALIAQRQIFNLIGALSDPETLRSPITDAVLEKLENTFFNNASQVREDARVVADFRHELDESIGTILLQPENGANTPFGEAQKKLLPLMVQATEAAAHQNGAAAQMQLWIQNLNGHHPLNGTWIRNALLISATALSAGAAGLEPDAAQEMAMGLVASMQAGAESMLSPLMYLGTVLKDSLQTVGSFFNPNVLKQAYVKPMTLPALAYIATCIVGGYSIAHITSQFYKLGKDLRTKHWEKFKNEWTQLHSSRWETFRDYFIKREKENKVAYGYMAADDPRLKTLTFRQACASFLFGFQTVMIAQGTMAQVWNAYFRFRNKIMWPVRSVLQSVFPNIQKTVETGALPSVANGGLNPFYYEWYIAAGRIHQNPEEAYRKSMELTEAQQSLEQSNEYKTQLKRELTIAREDQKVQIQTKIDAEEKAIEEAQTKVKELSHYLHETAAQEVRNQKVALDVEIKLRKRIFETALEETLLYVREHGLNQAVLTKSVSGKPPTIDEARKLAKKLSLPARRFFSMLLQNIEGEILPLVQHYIEVNHSTPPEDEVNRWYADALIKAKKEAKTYAQSSMMSRILSLKHWKSVGTRLMHRFFIKVGAGGLQKKRAAYIDTAVENPEKVKRAAIDNLTTLKADKPMEILFTLAGYAGTTNRELQPIQDELFSNTSVFGASTMIFGEGFLEGLAMWLLAGTWGVMQTQRSLDNSPQFDMPPTPEEQARYKTFFRWFIHRTWGNPENSHWHNWRENAEIIYANWRAALFNISILQRIFLGRFDLDLYVAGYISSFLTCGIASQMEMGFWRSTGWFAKDFTPDQLKDPQVQAVLRERIQKAQIRFKYPFNAFWNVYGIMLILSVTHADAPPPGIDETQWSQHHTRDLLAHVFGGQTPTEWAHDGLNFLEGVSPDATDPVIGAIKSFIGLERPGTYGSYPRLPVPK